MEPEGGRYKEEEGATEGMADLPKTVKVKAR